MSDLIDLEKGLAAANLAFKALPKSKPQEDSNKLNYLVELGGLSMLVHFFELGEHLVQAGHKRVSDKTAKAIDPRNLVEPRKQFIPR